MDVSFSFFIYKLLLLLFPAAFREEYGEEMLSVFQETLNEARENGRFTVWKTLLVELIGLPSAAFQYQPAEFPYLRARNLDWDKPPTRREILAVLTVFMVPGTAILLNLPVELISISLIGLLVGVFVAGLARGFQRWSLPALGLGLSAFSFMYLFQWAADLVTPAMLTNLGILPHDESTRLILHAFWAGLMWFSLFALTFLVLGVLAVMRKFRILLVSIQHDWTIASYILYSGAIFTLLLTFNQYRYDKTFALASSLCLATGAWLYLKSPRPWQRTLSLLTGLTLATGAIAASQWPAENLAGWRQLVIWIPPGSERSFEVYRVLLDWGWMVLFLLAPYLIRLFPSQNKRAAAGS
jgi:hypothetical protein